MTTPVTPAKKTLEGILVLGTDSSCGKTVVTAGLAKALNEEGFRVQALKPLMFCKPGSFYQGLDQNYLNKISGQYILVETQYADSAWDVNGPQWLKTIEQCKTLQYPCLLEGIGQVSTPWRLSRNELIDGLDVARDLGLSILLVGKGGKDFFDKTRSALEFIKSRNLQSIGFIQADASPETMNAEINQEDWTLLSQLYATPFLGHLPYSPSISVPTQQQGNLLRLVEENIDLLPLQMGMGLRL